MKRYTASIMSAAAFLKHRVAWIAVGAIGFLMMEESTPGSGQVVWGLIIIPIAAVMAIGGMPIVGLMLAKPVRWFVWAIIPFIILQYTNTAITDARLIAPPSWKPPTAIESAVYAYFAISISLVLPVALIWCTFYLTRYGGGVERWLIFVFGMAVSLFVGASFWMDSAIFWLAPLSIFIMWIIILLAHKLLRVRLNRAILFGSVVLWSSVLYTSHLAFLSQPRLRMSEAAKVGTGRMTVTGGAGPIVIQNTFVGSIFEGGEDYAALLDFNALELLLVLSPIWFSLIPIILKDRGRPG